MCTHAPGRRSAASARTNNTKHVPERADHELFGSYLTKSLLRVPEFRWVAAFRGVYEHPTHLTSDDDAPTTRKKKSASQATVRADPPAKRVGGGHGGAVVLVARARSFVWCVTPRGAGAFKSQAAAAAWWDVPWYVGRTKRHGVGFYSFHDSLKRSPSTPMAKPRGLDDKCQ